MAETTDGFLISEADMKMRGPGDMEGTQQSGLAFNLRVANLARDGQIISLAREVAGSVLDANPVLLAVDGEITEKEGMKLSSHSLSLLQNEMRLRFHHDYDWSRIS